jgi:hypothetical protein
MVCHKRASLRNPAVDSGRQKDDREVGHVQRIGVCYQVALHLDSQSATTGNGYRLVFIAEFDD